MRRPASHTCVLSPVEAAKVKTFPAEDGGYQRPLDPAKVAGVRDALERFKWAYFPPILVARVAGDGLYDIDGQHRRNGHIAAGVEVQAVVVDMTLEDARNNFLLHNYRSTRPTQTHILRVARNPIAVTMRELADRYKATVVQIRRLAAGVAYGLSTRGFDLVDPSAEIAPEVIAKIEMVMSIWTAHRYWKPVDYITLYAKCGGTPHIDLSAAQVYGSPGTLHMLGSLARDLPEQKLRKAIIAIQKMPWKKSSWFHSNVRTGVGDVCKMVRHVEGLLFRNSEV